MLLKHDSPEKDIVGWEKRKSKRRHGLINITSLTGL